MDTTKWLNYLQKVKEGKQKHNRYVKHLKELASLPVEWVLLLEIKNNECVNIFRYACGNEDECDLPSFCVKGFIKSDKIIIAHNHPDQDCYPSEIDDRLTKEMIRQNKKVGIDIIDHIIVNNKNEWFSYKDENHIF